jgi:hypothetical protein
MGEEWRGWRDDDGSGRVTLTTLGDPHDMFAGDHNPDFNSLIIQISTIHPKAFHVLIYLL